MQKETCAGVYTHTYINIHIYIYIYIYIFIFSYFHHTTCESTCDNLPPSADNQFRSLKTVLPLLALPNSYCHRTGFKRIMYIYTYIYIYIYTPDKLIAETTLEVSEVGDRSKGRREGSFSIATSPRCKRGRYSFPRLIHFTLDTYLKSLSVKPGGIKYHF